MAIDTTSTDTRRMPPPPCPRRAGSASAWSATRSWASPTRRAGATPAASSTRPWCPTSSRSAAGTRAAAGEMARRFDWQHVETDWRALVAAPTSTSSTSAPRGHPRRDRHRGPRRRQARALREAAGQHRRRGPGHGGGRGAARAHGIRSMVGFTYRRVPAIALARQLVQEGRIGELRHVRAQYLQDWLVDPRDAAHLAAPEGPRRVGCARRHRGAHHRPHPLRHRGELTGVSALMETFVHERPLPGAVRGLSAEVGSGRGRSPSTTRRSSSPGSAAGDSRPSRPPASPPGARTRSGWRSTAPRAASRSTSRT